MNLVGNTRMYYSTMPTPERLAVPMGISLSNDPDRLRCALELCRSLPRTSRMLRGW